MSEALEAAILGALRKNPDERPSPARALRKELLRAVPAAATIDYEDVAGLLRELFPEGGAAQPQGPHVDELTRP